MRNPTRRTVRAISLFQALTVVITLVIACMNRGPVAPGTVHNPIVAMFLSPYFYLVLAALAIMGLDTWLRYTKDWYKPDLALKYQDVFEGDELRKARAAAAKQFKAGKKYDAETKEIEIVLDVFEDIGFYVMHDEISAEVAHHHFYHWIRGYVQTASDYIANYQATEPAAYEHCTCLLKATSKIESKKSKDHVSKLRLNDEKIAEFIEDEAGMADSKD